MASLKNDTTIKKYQQFIKEVYGLNNDRFFSLWDMLSNIERFSMRGLKGIRKEDKEKTKINLLIAMSWFMSLMNRLHIDIEKETWQRFPYLCSYCAACPCECKDKKIETRQEVIINDSKKPNNLNAFQIMFNKIYPAKNRSLDHAGVHLAEEIGEFSESILTYRGAHKEEDFTGVKLEAADVVSCILGVYNSLNIDIAEELATLFSNNCHVCHKKPCSCSFTDITSFSS